MKWKELATPHEAAEKKEERDALKGCWRIMTGERTPRISFPFRQLGAQEKTEPLDYTKQLCIHVQRCNASALSSKQYLLAGEWPNEKSNESNSPIQLISRTIFCHYFGILKVKIGQYLSFFNVKICQNVYFLFFGSKFSSFHVKIVKILVFEVEIGQYFRLLWSKLYFLMSKFVKMFIFCSSGQSFPVFT